MKKEIVLAMAGAGRACELHMNAIRSFTGIPIRYKYIYARRQEQVDSAKKNFNFDVATTDFNEILNDPEVDVVDICTPPYLHEQMIRESFKYGKHVICEKPLSGYFGNGSDDVGIKTSKREMYKFLLDNLEKLKSYIASSDRKFMYAENFVYAPSVLKAAEIITKKKSKILFMKGEESLKGSSSPVAGLWSKTGGGTFIRTGAHPLSAILFLKKQEAICHNKTVYVESVIADTDLITSSLDEYEHRHIAARPIDVEDFSAAIIKFSDKTRALIIATDTLLGGSKNYIELYCNDTAINCKLTMSDLMSTYFLDEDNLDDVYISEMLPKKTGWNNPFLADEFIRGYNSEMQDFMECIYYDRTPKSDFELAYNSIKLIYAVYLSAEEQRAIKIDNMLLNIAK